MIHSHNVTDRPDDRRTYGPDELPDELATNPEKHRSERVSVRTNYPDVIVRPAPLPLGGGVPDELTEEGTMSLAINIDHVTAVLIAGQWYDVADDSFDLDAYEYIWHRRNPNRYPDDDPQLMHGGGHSGICATGFVFRTKQGDRMAGPLTSIQAVRHNTEARE